jgi:hypothetical protein
MHAPIRSACDENIGAGVGVPVMHLEFFCSATAQAKQKTGCAADN